MSIIICCANCSQKLRIPTKKIGDVGSCPKCKSKFKADYAPDRKIAVMTMLDSGESKSPAKQAIAILDFKGQTPPRQNKATPIAYGGFQQAPFLIDDGAIVDYPWCNNRMRVDNCEFNEELECPACDHDFKVIVKDRNQIPIQCPNCLLRMIVKLSKAGKRTKCIESSCNFGPIMIPATPIVLKKVNRPAQQNNKVPNGIQLSSIAKAAAIIVASSLLTQSRGRLCRKCFGRYVRNPSGYCYKCR